MKNIIALIAFTISLCNSNAQTHLVKNANEEVVAYVNNSISVFDLNSYKLFEITSSNVFINNSNDTLATYNPTTGIYTDLNNDFIIKYTDYKIYNQSNIQIGHIESNGEIYDINNHLIGKTNSENFVLVAYFYWIYNQI